MGTIVADGVTGRYTFVIGDAGLALSGDVALSTFSPTGLAAGSEKEWFAGPLVVVTRRPLGAWLVSVWENMPCDYHTPSGSASAHTVHNTKRY